MDNAPIHRSKLSQSFLEKKWNHWVKRNNQKIRFESPEEIDSQGNFNGSFSRLEKEISLDN